MSNLFSLHGPFFTAFTGGISAGADRTATSTLCRHSESNPGVGGGWCFFKPPIFVFLTHQAKSPEQNSLHPAADLSSAKQGGGGCRAPEKGRERASTGPAPPCLPAQKRRRGGEDGCSSTAAILSRFSHSWKSLR